MTSLVLIPPRLGLQTREERRITCRDVTDTDDPSCYTNTSTEKKKKHNDGKISKDEIFTL